MSKSIVFAIYKNNEFQGFRQDTFGTIGKDWAKIYSYSNAQVATVIKNIEDNLKGESNLGKFLGNDIITNHEKAIHDKVKDLSVFEVRVLEGPPKYFEKNFNVEKAEWEEDLWPTYKAEDLKNICENPDDQNVIEVHKLALTGRLEQN